MIEIDAELGAAITAVRAAAGLCERVRVRNAHAAKLKVDRSPVTIADYGAQAVACRLLADAFPGDPIVAEEGSSALRGADTDTAATLQQLTALVSEAVESGRDRPVRTEDVLAWIDLGDGRPAARFWTLDPIDGTRGFLRGDHYAVALALIVDRQVRAAALACPALDAAMLGLAPEDGPEAGAGSLVIATRGGGAWAAPLRAAASGDRWCRLAVCDMDTADCRRFVESVEARHANHAMQGAIARSAGIDAPPLRMDSQAKYAAIAAGRAALYLRLPRPGIDGYREKIWDHAAGALIVEEAGGRVTDMRGRPLDFGGAMLAPGGGVVASNGVIHAAVIGAIADEAP